MRPNAITALIIMMTASMPAGASAEVRVETSCGTLEGAAEASGIRSFKGVPFARPPVGDLRWKPPQPPARWEGVRKADRFGPRAMQRPIFGDMNFRSNGMGEDCLYLNVWTPAKGAGERLPVLVYFYGGGFMAGDGSEPRYDGESMARKGIVSVTVNYRLGPFGFMAHPELTKESPHHASGNYGLLDQQAALAWVRENIAAFGGDPAKVTIGGESAGSISVSAQMASPLSKGLIAGAIAESGSLMGTLSPVPLADAEKTGVKFAEKLKAKSLEELRALPAEKVLEATADRAFAMFPIAIDGYFLPRDPVAIFEAGEQAHVPLLAGWNSQEMGSGFVLQSAKPTKENFAKAVKRLFKDHADEVVAAYAAETDEEVLQAATDLAGDQFIGYSTWKLADSHGRTGGSAVYRYLYARPRPAMRPEMGDAEPGLAGGVKKGQGTAKKSAAPRPPDRGAVHSAEIEYALGNLATNEVYAWTPQDHRVAEVMQAYFANFIKTGDPNGSGLPPWPTLNRGDGIRFQRIDVDTRPESDRYRARYLLLDRLRQKKD